ncbi:ABC transporter ATP-binding protein [Microcystis wesenbergii NRERC-220]|uniref:ABC transporter ATP-binding protein n=1 Tax=Microcystis wesenbergii NRERC-220 TaxID=3068991 RepID=A0ABU3HS55_9CHRO|nr:ABC transporter ATP-binding protein [Microcystis wesenbergii]MDT3676188.1 ABC transporter ATP-binding protein [Microcystis wesenbergii NRERC-220]
MTDTIIEVENLGKRYVLDHQRQREKYTALRDVIAQGVKSALKGFGGKKTETKEEFWALKDVSFQVKRGEVVGIIGRNGAGKSTLLKILSRITEPTTGRVRLKGRVASLLEVGTGFHPELTGRENIYLNGAVLGMMRQEIDRKFDEIVAFAEVEKFLDTPVKRYSSGMYVRLAFAVAAHLEPEILVVDEVLAVGDAAFQKKCLGKMGDVASKEGRTVLFVSHQMATIENLCQKVILLNSGQIIDQGKAENVISFYLKSILPNVILKKTLKDRKDRSGNGKIRLINFYIEDNQGNTLNSIMSGMNVVFVFEYQLFSDSALNHVDVGFSLHSDNDQTLFVLYSSYLGKTFEKLPLQGLFKCVVNDFPLSEGRYKVGARVTVAGEEADWPNDGIGYLDVERGDFYGSGSIGFEGKTPFLVKGKWDLHTVEGDYE